MINNAKAYIFYHREKDFLNSSSSIHRSSSSICKSTKSINFSGKELQLLSHDSLISLIETLQKDVTSLMEQNKELEERLKKTNSTILTPSSHDDLVTLLKIAIAQNKLPEKNFTRILFTSVLKALVAKVRFIFWQIESN
jgi:hypothetical protein